MQLKVDNDIILYKIIYFFCHVFIVVCSSYDHRHVRNEKKYDIDLVKKTFSYL